MIPELRALVTNLAFGESPRWHDGRLWFSDFGANEVLTVDLDGSREVIARVPGMPMGLGFLPDGRLLVVSARDGQLLAARPGAPLTGYADLSALSRHPWSDMVVDGRGHAYVGNIGFDFPASADPDRVARTAAAAGVVVLELTRHTDNLEELFFDLTSDRADDRTLEVSPS